MERLLTIGEVAKRLRVSVDVVRSLTTSGKLKAVRTDGGHRRYRPEDVDRFQAKGRPRAQNRSVTRPSVHEARPSVSGQDDPELDDDTLEELEAEAERAEARARAEAEGHRLEIFKKYGRDHAKWTILPTDWHAKVIEDLEDFVTTKRFPPSLPAVDAQMIVQARVNSIANQFRASEIARQQKERDAAEERRKVEDDRRRADDDRRQQEREAEEQRRQQQEDEQKVKALIEHGNNRASSRTIGGWDWSDAQRARRDVERALREEVKADWSEDDVDDLVDDELAEWKEEGEDEAEDES
jgi:excisionase family DNA binding protein